MLSLEKIYHQQSWSFNSFVLNKVYQNITDLYQNLTRNVFHQKHVFETSFFEKAQNETEFQRYQAWCDRLSEENSGLYYTLKEKALTPHKLRKMLLQHQSKTIHQIISPTEYDHQIKKLEQKLNSYGDVFHKVRHRLKKQLKKNPALSLRCFYNDIINNIIQFSGQRTSSHSLQTVLSYYQELVPTSIYSAVTTAISLFLVDHRDELYKENPYGMHISESVYKELLKKINSAFTPQEKNATSTTKLYSGSRSSLPIAMTIAPWIMSRGTGAQSIPHSGYLNFIETLGGASYDDSGGVLQTPDGGYLITGITSGFGVSSLDLFLAKLDRDGTARWANTLGGVNSDVAEFLQITTDGNYIVGGYTASPNPSAGYDLLLTKWDPSGKLLWAKTAGGSGNEQGLDAQATPDGGCIVSGFTDSSGAGNSDVWLTKWDINGNLVWTRTLGGQGDDRGNSVKTTSDGSYYIIAGETMSYGARGYDMLFSKWRNDGTLVWAKTLGGLGHEYGLSTQITKDGKYIVTGSTDNDLLLTLWHANGTLEWAKKLGGRGTEQGFSIQTANDGGYVVLGDTSSSGAGNFDLLLTRWFANGTLSWAKAVGGSGIDNGRFLQATLDGGYIAQGSTTSFGSGHVETLLVKLDSQGNIDGCSELQTISPTVNFVELAVNTITPIVEIPSFDVNTWEVNALPINLTQTKICFPISGTSTTGTTGFTTTTSSSTSSTGSTGEIIATTASNFPNNSDLTTATFSFSSNSSTSNQFNFDSQSFSSNTDPILKDVISVAAGIVAFIICIGVIYTITKKCRNTEEKSDAIELGEISIEKAHSKGRKYRFFSNSCEEVKEALLKNSNAEVVVENGQAKMETKLG